MLEQILKDIGVGALENALIRLWLWAESTQNGRQMLSTWRTGFNRAAHERAVAELLAALNQKRFLVRAAAGGWPLALIAALDQFVGENAELPGGKGCLPRLEDQGVGYWLIPRVPRRAVPADDQEPNLDVWFRHFRVIPERIGDGTAIIDVELISVPGDRDSAAAMPRSVRVSHFDDAVTTSFIDNGTGESFYAEGLADSEKRRASLNAELDELRARRHLLWVAPELTVTPALRNWLKRQLAEQPLNGLLLAIPGSFHEAEDGERVNRAEIIDGAGGLLASHDKLTLFSYPRPADQRACCEEIVARRKITLLITPLGLVGVAICKDFSDKTTPLIHAAWSRLAPDWLLVPSMGDDPTLKLHRSRAEEYAKFYGTHSVVANQQAFVKEARPGFICFSGGSVDAGAGGSSHDMPASREL